MESLTFQVDRSVSRRYQEGQAISVKTRLRASSVPCRLRAMFTIAVDPLRRGSTASSRRLVRPGSCSRAEQQHDRRVVAKAREHNQGVPDLVIPEDERLGVWTSSIEDD